MSATTLVTLTDVRPGDQFEIKGMHYTVTAPPRRIGDVVLVPAIVRQWNGHEHENTVSLLARTCVEVARDG